MSQRKRVYSDNARNLSIKQFFTSKRTTAIIVNLDKKFAVFQNCLAVSQI